MYIYIYMIVKWYDDIIEMMNDMIWWYDVK